MDTEYQHTITHEPLARIGGVSDLDAIAQLYRTQLGREPDLARIGQYLEEFPSAIAEVAGFGIVAFAFTTRFAPDILELANILVDANWRNRAIGSQLLELIEDLAKESFSAIILVNSMLYSTVGKKRLASDFYLRAGYQNILKTPSSFVYSKPLR
jgi:GNAT superfamily N-acetyltransferase